jgi:opine dehydrogenase
MGARMVNKTRIAVLGSGHSGLTLAGDLVLAGFEVNLFAVPEFSKTLRNIQKHGGIEIDGACRSGFAKLNKTTTDIEEALQGVNVVLIAIPAYAHKKFAEVCAPYLEEGQIVVLNGEYTFGVIEFANTIQENGCDLDKITLGGTNALIYRTRMYLPNKVWCNAVKAEMPFAAFPAKKTEKALEVLKPIYQQDDGKRGILVPASSILETSICNINPYRHVPMMILNAVGVELGDEPYSKYVGSEACRRTTEALDREAMFLQKSLGTKPLSYYYVRNVMMYPSDLIYAPQNTPEWVKRENQPTLFRGGKGSNFLNLRYLTEDVPYGLVGLASLGDMLSVDTPTFDSLITIASVINGVDYWKEGRTLEKLGFSDLTKDELLRLVMEGEISKSL